MRDRLHLALLLLLATVCTATKHLPHRRSCRDHYLSGHDESGVYPIRVHKHESNVSCIMPPVGSQRPSVHTVIRSALERGLRVDEARTVQWQLNDFTLLREILERSTSCVQTVYYERTAPKHIDYDYTTPAAETPGIVLHSVLGEMTEIKGDQESGYIKLIGRAAGILHVVPDDLAYPYNPLINASSLECEEQVLKYEECWVNGGVLINTRASTHPHFRFSFLTDITNQPLLIAHHENGAKTVIELVNDFFLTIGEDPQRLAIGHISDGKWHTAQIALDGTHLSIDGRSKIALPVQHGEIHQVSIRINGHIMLTDPADEAEACSDPKRLTKEPQQSHTQPFCTGASPCECTMLDDYFRLLPSTACLHEERQGEAFTLTRDPQYLSFLMLPDSLSSSRLALSLTFKSDADSGLLLFGEWRNDSWGRIQVHYHGADLSAIHCTQQDENSIEICRACAIRRNNGYGTDTWTRVATFADRDGQVFLTVDSEICHLSDTTDDTAEMYKTVLTRGSVLFVGGMFNKKVKSGIYRDEFKAKFFENTREKLPSLRGCVKDLFIRQDKIDFATTFRRQWQTTLINPDPKFYAIKMDCGTCPMPCKLKSRCRPTHDDNHKCDCADIEQYDAGDQCREQTTKPLSLERSSPTAYRGEFSVRSLGVLSKIWMKIKLPSLPLSDDIPIIHFFSHAKSVLFRIYLTTDQRLAVQVNPGNRAVYFPHAQSEPFDISDDRIHLITIEKRTPLGTHPSRRFYDLYIDGQQYSIPDPGMTLTTIEFNLIETDQEGKGGCVSDLGISFDPDELRIYNENDNKIATINVLEEMANELGIGQSREGTCGVIDPLLWTKGGFSLGPVGHLVAHEPNGYEGHTSGHGNTKWILYSVILTTLLALLLLLCILVYLCCLRKSKRKDSYDDQERMLRESPDTITYRRATYGGDDTSLVSDSIDKTDFSMYDEPKMCKSKVDRESMVSFVEPTAERSVKEAQIVVRSATPNYAPLVRDDQSDL